MQARILLEGRTKDNGDNNESNTNEFKKVDGSTLAIATQQVNNLRDNAAVIIDSIRLTTGDTDIIVNGIDYVWDVGYTYEMKKYNDIFVALPNSIIHTPQNSKSLNEFRATLNVIYYIKVMLLHTNTTVRQDFGLICYFI